MDLVHLLNFCPFPSCKSQFQPSTAKLSARRNAFWPESKTEFRKNSPFERILRIWNLLPNLGLNLSAVIYAAEKENGDPDTIMRMGANGC